MKNASRYVNILVCLLALFGSLYWKGRSPVSGDKTYTQGEKANVGQLADAFVEIIDDVTGK